MSPVRAKALEDPDYCPYCLRCPRLVRMVKVEPMLWRCDCGAVHDERELAVASPVARPDDHDEKDIHL